MYTAGACCAPVPRLPPSASEHAPVCVWRGEQEHEEDGKEVKANEVKRRERVEEQECTGDKEEDSNALR